MNYKELLDNIKEIGIVNYIMKDIIRYEHSLRLSKVHKELLNYNFKEYSYLKYNKIYGRVMGEIFFGKDEEKIVNFVGNNYLLRELIITEDVDILFINEKDSEKIIYRVYLNLQID